jgi:hypothetical protein
MTVFSKCVSAKRTGVPVILRRSAAPPALARSGEKAKGNVEFFNMWALFGGLRLTVDQKKSSG